MKFTIYYMINFADSLKFIGLNADEGDELIAVELKSYKRVAEIEADDLEDAFRRMNAVDGSDIELPRKLGCRSMSVGDIAIDEAGAGHLCAGCGWVKAETQSNV
jgi:hypothetical protein